MCGRFTLKADPAQLVDAFDCDATGVSGQARFNIAPGQQVLIVVESLDDERARRVIRSVEWGLIPSWSKERPTGRRLINARVETVTEKPSFRSAARKRRCVVPASGYYEWYTPARGAKQPFYIHSDELLGMAGIYEYWTDPAGDTIETVCILTQAASPDLERIHDRMPVFIPREHLDEWLDPERTDGATAVALGIRPPLEATPVSNAVNRPVNDGPALIEPIPVEQELW